MTKTPGRQPRPKLPASGKSPTPSNALKSKRGTMKRRTWQTTEEYEAAKRETAALQEKHKGAAFFFLAQTYGGDACVLNWGQLLGRVGDTGSHSVSAQVSAPAAAGGRHAAELAA